MSDFAPDCFGIRSNGQPMPARFMGLDAAGLLQLQAPNGRTYTFHADHVLPVEEVNAQLHTNRVAYVASHYTFEEISNSHGRREVRCVNPDHPVRSSYILTITRSRSSCTCPAFVKSAGAGCKHLEAFAAARSSLVERFNSPDADPLDAPLEYRLSTGAWRPLDKEDRGRFLDMVLEREPRFAPRVKRDPMTTRLQVVQFLAPGGEINYDSDWYAQLRINPGD